ncbi:MAG: class I SAM-dependent methyltransferase [Lachnospiraceae bacterium]|nr:class I SAM-dependent methyltransferase [Lachnospiraceae bacterium]
MNGSREAIGNVVLNYKYYSGEDLYSEGAGEDILLDLVSRYPEAEYGHIIQSTRSWSVMYHLSHVRENICSWLPITKKDNVLEIGAGCGAVTGCLARLAGHVTCIELSKKRSTINATRHKMLDNIEIFVGNFEDIEPDIEEKYDYITLVGVLEYAGSYIGSDDPYHEMLKRVRHHLKDGGRLIIAIENQLGLKYFAGCKEDHTNRFYEGIEGYTNTEGVRTFSKQGLERLLNESGYSTRFYYPYPDYKLPHTIYSDAWLPKPGELNTNLRNFDTDRVVTFNESRVFDTLIKENKFADFSNSFLVIATKEELSDDTVMPVYAKYASARAIEYRTATVIESDKKGRKREVFKIALSPEANAHIDSIYVNYLALSKMCAETGFKPDECRRISDEDNYAAVDLKENYNESHGISLEYIDGITMEEYLDELESRREFERMLLLMKQYEAVIRSVSKELFENSEGFRKLFGEDLTGEYFSAPVSDLDLIFTNIVFDREKKENGEWNLLDYEWTFSFPIPVKFIIYRALFYYIKSHEGSAFLKYIKKRSIDLYAEFKISVMEKTVFKRLEKHFQLYIIKGAASLEVMHELMPVRTVDMLKAVEKEFYLKDLRNPKIYYGSGEGFSGDRQLMIFADTDGDSVSLEIPLEEDITQLRVDPTEYPCIVKIDKVTLIMDDGTSENIDRFLTNGYVGEGSVLLFDTDDSQLQFLKLPEGKKTVGLKYDVTMVEKGLFEGLKRMFWDRMKRFRKDPTVIDKLLVKAGRKEPGVIPEGYYEVRL